MSFCTLEMMTIIIVAGEGHQTKKKKECESEGRGRKYNRSSNKWNNRRKSCADVRAEFCFAVSDLLRRREEIVERRKVKGPKSDCVKVKNGRRQRSSNWNRAGQIGSEQEKEKYCAKEVKTKMMMTRSSGQTLVQVKNRSIVNRRCANKNESERGGRS